MFSPHRLQSYEHGGWRDEAANLGFNELGEVQRRVVLEGGTNDLNAGRQPFDEPTRWHDCDWQTGTRRDTRPREVVEVRLRRPLTVIERKS